MKKLSLALAFALSLAALPAAAFEGCGGYAQTPATPVATTEEATTPVTVAVDQAQPTDDGANLDADFNRPTEKIETCSDPRGALSAPRASSHMDWPPGDRERGFLHRLR